MEALPLIPGYSFQNPCNHDHKLKQKLDHKDGYRVVRDSFIGTGRRPVDAASSAYSGRHYENFLQYDPSLTYGRNKDYPCRQVIPHYVLFAQKCLKFKAFFRQSVFNSPMEHFRIRHVNIIYFLEDDTMCVIEPSVDNAGLQQGKLVRRGKIPKENSPTFYHWKDLNVGINISIYGVVYHTVDCDTFTEEYMRSQGIDPGNREQPPPDSYTQDRLAKLAVSRASSSRSKKPRPEEDPRRRFLEFDGMVLTFDAIWNEDSYQIMYFLTDDTIAVKEMIRPNSGKDPNRMLLKKTKIPKNWTDLPVWYPSIYLERTDEEVVEYYCPMDLKVGETIFIFGRKFLLLDCDSFTRRYYKNMLGIEQPPRIFPTTSSSSRCLASPHPTSCTSLSKKSKKEDVIRQIFNHPKKLRYLMTMVAVRPEDEGREFILEYSLSHGTIKINELSRKNSGRRAGCFLASRHIPKSHSKLENCDEEVPIYTPRDLYIGAIIDIFSHRFLITGADLFVMKYIEENQDKFPEEVVENMRSYFNRVSVGSSERVEDIKDDHLDNFVKTKKNDCLIPATKQIGLSPDAQKIDSGVPQPQDEQTNPCQKYERDRSLPKQITWADQVQVPCTLMTNT
ncbi:EF-hand domain-containing protein 1-like [Diachasmimorpha longicaudata]|uniref:EF-hand domain-containing protein 1-like n=1 Tax=Diachasmimorpha longicaudata TaxID=58733 RepID=UPI0030B90916